MINDVRAPAGALTAQAARVFEAPRPLVFEAWTNPLHFARWMRPRVFESVEIQEMDVRPGGKLRMLLRAPNGDEYSSNWTYGEIVRPERLTYDESCYENGRLFHKASQIVRFEDLAGKTRLTIEARLELVADRDPRWTPDAMTAGWSAGWNDNLDLLLAYLTELRAAAT